MENANQEDILDPKEYLIEYSKFWTRFAAILIDGIVLSPVAYAINYFNIVEWKSVFLMLLVFAIQIAYKPILEFKYAATVGKMAMGIKVTNNDYGRASLNEILLRDSPTILAGILGMVGGLLAFNNPAFSSITKFNEYNHLLSRIGFMTIINLSVALFFLVDGVFLMISSKSQSLHDLMAGTFVIKKQK